LRTLLFLTVPNCESQFPYRWARRSTCCSGVCPGPTRLESLHSLIESSAEGQER